MPKVTQFPRLKIVSDGRGAGTKIIEVATGQEVLAGCVRHIAWEVGAGSLAQVRIELLPTAVEVEGECEVLETAEVGG